MSAVFVTGSGTAIGKTFVVRQLIERFRRVGQPVGALKPVVSGFDPACAGESDPGLILRALGELVDEIALDRISPWRFRAPLSPDSAAAREGRQLDFAALVAYTRDAIARAGSGRLIVEGIGGIMVPLDAAHTVLDWIGELGVPTLLVAGSYLGAISHALTAARAARAADQPLAAIVVNESPQSGVPLAETVASIARFVAPVPVLPLARTGLAQPDDAAALFDFVGGLG